MKLKSLKLALNCMELIMVRGKDDKLKEAIKDVRGCIEVTEKQLDELKSADILDAIGSCLCFNILVDFPERLYWKKDDPLNPYLRAEKIEKEQKNKGGD